MIHRRQRPKAARTQKIAGGSPVRTDRVLDQIKAGVLCACGKPAHFGEGVSIRAGQLGVWRCHGCWQEVEAAA